MDAATELAEATKDIVTMAQLMMKMTEVAKIVSKIQQGMRANAELHQNFLGLLNIEANVNSK